MQVSYTKFIQPLEYSQQLEQLLINSPKLGTMYFADREQIQTWLESVDKDVTGGTCLMSAGFDDNHHIINFMTGYTLHRIAGWYLGYVKIRDVTNHFYNTAAIIKEANDQLILEMENRGYYKFWVIGPYRELEIRFSIMGRVSTVFSRYTSYEEQIIPRGTRSSIAAWNSYIHPEHDSVVKMMVLRNEYRKQYLQLPQFLMS